ncbi:MAG: hypothetical protein IKP34_07230 [Bacteroidales bacterium]|nr:hypothetical protein [Bacteroidales bacterium]
MVKHINIKQTALLLACLLAVGTVSSQENEAGKRKVNPWAEFNLGVNFLDGSKGFNDHMQTYHPTLDYRSAYSAAAQIGVGLGMEYRRFTLGIHLNGMADNILSVKNQLVKKQDNLYHLDLGYRFDLGKNYTLEPTAGFGVCISDIFLSSSRGGTDYVNSFSTVNFAVPLTINFWHGKNGKDSGLYVQYIISVGQVGKAHITGLDTEVDDLNFLPATLTLGWKYRF